MRRYEVDFIKREYMTFTVYADSREEAHEKVTEYKKDLGPDWEFDYLAGPFEDRRTNGH